jgi:hypothetical protein
MAIDYKKLIQEIVRKQITESRTEEFRNKYNDVISDEMIDLIISSNPGRKKNQKYLDWMGRVLGIRGKLLTKKEVIELSNKIEQFDRYVRGVDIYRFKDLEEFEQYMDKVIYKLQNRLRKRIKEDEVFLNNNYRIINVTNFESCKFYGGSTKWCISTNKKHFDNYFNKEGNDIIIVINRKTKKKYVIISNVSDDLDDMIFYNSEDQILSDFMKKEFIKDLESAIDIHGNTAKDVIEDLINIDSGMERRADYIFTEYLESYESNNRGFEVDFVRNLESYLGVEDLDDKWDEIVSTVFGEELDSKGYNIGLQRFLFDIWTYMGMEWGVDDAGWMPEISKLDNLLLRYSDENHELLKKLEHEIEKIFNYMDKIDEMVSNSMGNLEFDTFYIKWNKIYTAAKKEVNEYLENTLNNPNQTLFPFGEKVIGLPKNIEEFIDILEKLGYTEMVKDIKRRI